MQVDCANGQTGFGKRRRRNPDISAEKNPKNKIYEVSMSTVVRVGDDADVTSDKQTSSRQQKETFIVEEGKLNLFDYKNI